MEAGDGEMSLPCACNDDGYHHLSGCSVVAGVDREMPDYYCRDECRL